MGRCGNDTGLTLLLEELDQKLLSIRCCDTKAKFEAFCFDDHFFAVGQRGGIDDTSHDAFRGRVRLEGSEYSTFSSRAFEGQPVRPVAYGIECIIR